MPSRSTPSRRQIREAVVQLLYSVDPEAPLPKSTDLPILDLLLEPLRERAVRARAKAVVHLQQGRDKTAEPLVGLLVRLVRVDLGDQDSNFPKSLRELHDSEEQLGESLEHLRHELGGSRSPRRLAALLEECRSGNLHSKTAAAKIQATDPAFPALQQLRLDALRVWEALRPLAERLDAALSRKTERQPELRAVTQAEADVEQLADRVRAYLDLIASHLDEIDRRLAETIDNYSPARIDRVDRAILRLGACELLFDPDLPPAVAINEAIELARAFGTTQSPRFVNGILDRLHKAAASDS